MIERSYDPDQLRVAMVPFYEQGLVSNSFDYDEWVHNENNVLLRDGESYGLFEYEYKGLFSGHYAFTVKGRPAIKLGEDMLKEVFAWHGAQTIRGMTPTYNKAARWMNRKLGFKSYGVFQTEDDEFELFCLTVDEFYHHLNTKEDHN